MPDTRSLAQQGYEAFTAAMDARGHQYRTWGQLSEDAQEGWHHAAAAVVAAWERDAHNPPTMRTTP